MKIETKHIGTNQNEEIKFPLFLKWTSKQNKNHYEIVLMLDQCNVFVLETTIPKSRDEYNEPMTTQDYGTVEDMLNGAGSVKWEILKNYSVTFSD